MINANDEKVYQVNIALYLLQRVHRMKINSKTQLCGVIGNPVEHSLSPAIHNAAFQHLDLNFVYLAFPVEDVAGTIHGIRALGNIRGFSITIPHKVSFVPYLDKLDETARHIGAINTIVKRDGLLVGYNTDALGSLRALDAAQVNLSGKEILILGSGGAARAIAFSLALNRQISGLTILGIEEKERVQLAEDLRKGTKIAIMDSPLTVKSLSSAIARSQLMIHCTPLGMHPNHDKTCVSKDLIKPHIVVMDIVYNPLETRLLREAKEVGCQTIRGIDMFLYQAVAQFELWTSQTAPINVMRKVLEAYF